MKNEKVIVFGSTGFIGIRVCEELKSTGYEVYSYVRPSSQTSAIAPLVKEFFTGSLDHRGFRENLVTEIQKRGIKKIIFMIGAVGYHLNYEQSRTVNLAPLSQVLEIARALHEKKALEKMVFLGSVINAVLQNCKTKVLVVK